MPRKSIARTGKKPRKKVEQDRDGWLLRADEDTDESMGKRPDERTVEELLKSAIVIIDKHAGPTSHQVTAWVARAAGAKKAGHAGTLDPGVTGVLPVALDDATKAMPALMGADKEYVGVMRIHCDVTMEQVRDKAAEFVGRIKQLPPVKSAVARKVRERDIMFFDILELDGRDALFHVGCQAGTYIRKLCHDFGQSLGCGAHMTELRRVRAGVFDEKHAHSLLDFKDAYERWKESGDERPLRSMLMPVEDALAGTKAVFIKDSAVDEVAHGAPLYAAGVTRVQAGIEAGDTVVLYTQKGEIVALGVARMGSEEMAAAKKGTAVRTDRVFMERGTYAQEKS
ncbi:MAG: RNA-guided pseudouridylation complex pseudouridine synthase subunit Cbf5 [Candidatus Aenigmarchaeota archaeon]|nr:RNA-guided pseudouridylation complex pseudouridine synthase subunit Cbf5 [Candidatus Aenigmarchaeota archaeon]